MFGRWLVPVLLAAVVGCAPKTVVPTVLPPGTEEALLAKVRQSGEELLSVKGLARVEVTHRGRSRAATHVLMAELPDRFRTETLSPFGQPLLLIASDGEELEVFVPTEGRFYRGDSSADNLQRFIPLPVAPTMLVELLLYRVPLGAFDRREVTLTREGGMALVLEGGGRRQRFGFDPSGRLVEADYFDGGRRLFRVSYGDFWSEGPLYPKHLDVDVPVSEVSASVDFDEVTLNEAIDRKHFRLRPPAGVEVLGFP